MNFTLTGLTTDGGFRRFRFEHADGSAPRTIVTVTVAVEMALAQKYNIPLQELPLLCRRLVEDRSDTVNASAVFGEKDMVDYVSQRRQAKALVDQKRGQARRFPKPTAKAES